MAYHPQANGLTERFNHILTSLLKSIINKQQNDWDFILPYVVFAYNTTVHESTGTTPFHAAKGHDPHQPIDFILQLEQSNLFNTAEVRIDGAAQSLNEILTKIYNHNQHTRANSIQRF